MRRIPVREGSLGTRTSPTSCHPPANCQARHDSRGRALQKTRLKYRHRFRKASKNRHPRIASSQVHQLDPCHHLRARQDSRRRCRPQNRHQQSLRRLETLQTQNPILHPKALEKLLAHWTLKETAVPGKMTNAAAATPLDLAPSAVRLKRLFQGISPFSRFSSN